MQARAPGPAPDGRDFSGLWIPLVTPFKQGELDLPALKKLVRHYSDCGVAGLVACGSTGEAAALTAEEQLAVLRAVLDTAGKLPVVMGLSGYNLKQSVDWVRELSTFALAGLLVPPPHYIRPSQAGLLTWFRAIADASGAPLIVYDIPYRTGVVIELPTLLALAGHGNVRAIKDCGGDTAKTQALILDRRLQVLAGEDAQLFNAVSAGAAGAITASAHIRTSEFVEVIRALQQGNLHQARQAWAPLPELISAMFAEPNPAPIKAALAATGWLQNELRPPMTTASQPVNLHLIANRQVARKPDLTAGDRWKKGDFSTL